jgi:hypothetical protein
MPPWGRQTVGRPEEPKGEVIERKNTQCPAPVERAENSACGPIVVQQKPADQKTRESEETADAELPKDNVPTGVVIENSKKGYGAESVELPATASAPRPYCNGCRDERMRCNRARGGGGGIRTHGTLVGSAVFKF